MEEDEREVQWLRNWTPMAVDYGEYDPLRAGSIDGTGTTPHDRGIVRAMATQYKPPKGLESDPELTLFVGRLNHDTTEDTLRAIFSECGSINSLRLVRDIVTGRSKGYAFVEFAEEEYAEKAYQRCHKMSVDGYQIIVEYECGRTLPRWIPRRFGGGFGGKKESGQLRFGGRDRPFRKPIVVGSKVLGSRGRRDRGEGVWREERRWGRDSGEVTSRRWERERDGRTDRWSGHPTAARERHDRSPRRQRDKRSPR